MEGNSDPFKCDLLSRLADLINRWFILSPGGEWTVEANPGTIDAEKADILATAGVNRIQFGVSHFSLIFRVLERNHGRAR